MKASLIKKMKNIKIFLMDVDGVLTDGKMYYFTDTNGVEHEFKAFNSQDGIGLIVLNKFSIKTGIITGRECESVYQRAKLLRMNFVYQGFLTKIWAVDEILKKTGYKYSDVCYMGDDLPDIPVLKKVGFSCCPKNSISDVKKVCDYVSRENGGNGAVREICELIIESKGLKKAMMKGFECGIWPEFPINNNVENILYSKWKNNK